MVFFWKPLTLCREDSFSQFEDKLTQDNIRQQVKSLYKFSRRQELRAIRFVKNRNQMPLAVASEAFTQALNGLLDSHLLSLPVWSRQVPCPSQINNYMLPLRLGHQTLASNLTMHVAKQQHQTEAMKDLHYTVIFHLKACCKNIRTGVSISSLFDYDYDL